MDGQSFNESLDSVRWMGSHKRGESEAGRMTEIAGPDVKAIQEATRLSQSRFALMPCRHRSLSVDSSRLVAHVALGQSCRHKVHSPAKEPKL